MKSRTLVLLYNLLLFITGMAQQQEELPDSLTLVMHQEYTDLKVALQQPDMVVKLSLRRKKLNQFPEELYQFKNLQYLDLSKNNIRELPDSIVSFKKMQYLILSRNHLKALPKNIGMMKNLRHLNVNQNDLKGLPYSFGKLENLEVADLWSNNLDYFPETMVNLKKLKWMDLRNILIPKEHQDRIQSMVPHAHIEFSPPCQCSW